MDVLKPKKFSKNLTTLAICIIFAMTMFHCGVDSNHIQRPSSASSQATNRGINSLQVPTNSRTRTSQARNTGSRQTINRGSLQNRGINRPQITARMLQNSQASVSNTRGRQFVPTNPGSRNQRVPSRQFTPNNRDRSRSTNQIGRARNLGPNIRPVTNQQADRQRASRRTIPPISQIAEILDALQAIIPMAESDRNQPRSRPSVPTMAESDRNQPRSRPSVPTMAESDRNQPRSRPSVPTMAESDRNQPRSRPSVPTMAESDRNQPRSRPSLPRSETGLGSNDNSRRRQSINARGSNRRNSAVQRTPPLPSLATRLQNIPAPTSRRQSPNSIQRSSPSPSSGMQRDVAAPLGQNVAFDSRLNTANTLSLDSQSMNVFNQINDEIFRSQNILSRQSANAVNNQNSFQRPDDNSRNFQNNNDPSLQSNRISSQPVVFRGQWNNPPAQDFTIENRQTQTGFQGNVQNVQARLNAGPQTSGSFSQTSILDNRIVDSNLENNRPVFLEQMIRNNDPNTVIQNSQSINVPTMAADAFASIQNTGNRDFSPTNAFHNFEATNQIGLDVGSLTNTGHSNLNVGSTGLATSQNMIQEQRQLDRNFGLQMVPELTQEQPLMMSGTIASVSGVQPPSRHAQQSGAETIQSPKHTITPEKPPVALGNKSFRDAQILKNIMADPLPSVPMTTPRPKTTTTPKKVVLQIDPSSIGIKIVPDGNGGVKVLSLRENPDTTMNGNNTFAPGTNSQNMTGTGQPFRQDSGGKGSLRSEIRSNASNLTYGQNNTFTSTLRTSKHTNVQLNTTPIVPTLVTAYAINTAQAPTSTTTTPSTTMTTTTSTTTTSITTLASTINPEFEIEATIKPSYVPQLVAQAKQLTPAELAGLGPTDRINTTDVPEEIELLNGTSLDGPGPGAGQTVPTVYLKRGGRKVGGGGAGGEGRGAGVGREGGGGGGEEVTTRHHMTAEEMEEYMAEMGLSTMEGAVLPFFMTTPMPSGEEEITTPAPPKAKTKVPTAPPTEAEPVVTEHSTVVSNPNVNNEQTGNSFVSKDHANVVNNTTIDLHVLTKALEAMVANAQSIPLQELAMEAGHAQPSETPIVNSHDLAQASPSTETPVDFTFQDFQHALSKLGHSNSMTSTNLEAVVAEQQQAQTESHTASATDQANDFYFYDKLFALLNGGRGDSIAPSEAAAEKTEIPVPNQAEVQQQQTNQEPQEHVQTNQEVGNPGSLDPIIVDNVGAGVFSMKDAQYTFSKSAEHNIGELISNSALKTAVKTVPRTKRHLLMAQTFKTAT